MADERTGLTALDSAKSLSIAAVSGGNGTVKEASGGANGLAASAHAVARFIWRHAVIGNAERNAGRNAGAARSGSTPGAATWAQSRTDNKEWTLFINSRQFSGNYLNFVGAGRRGRGRCELLSKVVSTRALVDVESGLGRKGALSWPGARV